ncbi:LacI family DNA-binding transcriptional regulator [Streptomyces sp. TRM68367]|uniref:LacI family DNA-binding transcriptional regulator n=1 Tax=Streptomyces sp. TRM68367 TaxID=2758415 RepID=UPI0029346DFB|nr:LacI family DNA-binding transcriptional regulator [Streptomyces sp. TRM68367]
MPRSSKNPSPKGGPVTLAMVAARAGVSKQTVSNAINSPDMLRPETLERSAARSTRWATGPAGRRRRCAAVRASSSATASSPLRPSPRAR